MRKVIFITALTMQVLDALSFLTLIIVILSENSGRTDLCDTFSHTWHQFSQCMNNYSWYLAIYIVGGFIATTLIGIFGLEVLYYGWKEQEKKKQASLVSVAVKGQGILPSTSLQHADDDAEDLVEEESEDYTEEPIHEIQEEQKVEKELLVRDPRTQDQNRWLD